jgi:hypothetical protein
MSRRTGRGTLPEGGLRARGGSCPLVGDWAEQYETEFAGALSSLRAALVDRHDTTRTGSSWRRLRPAAENSAWRALLP